MDIDYLLWLQGLRESLPEFVEVIAALFSDVIGAGIVTMVVPLLVYWLLDRHDGLAILLSFGIGSMANQLIKAILCVPRPWLLDERVQPAERALSHATGYSFPSGHSQGAFSVYVALAWIKRHAHVLISLLLVLMTLLTGLSRNFLGVHTPQDVLVAFGIGLVGIAIALPLARKLQDAGPAGQLIAVMVALAAVTGMLVFVTLKEYPVSYVNGVPTSDALDMKGDCYASAGFMTGLALGWLLERIFVNGFEAPTTLAEGAVRAALGAVVAAGTYLLISTFAKPVMGELWCEFTRAAAAIMLAVGIVPCFFPAIGERLGRKSLPAHAKEA